MKKFRILLTSLLALCLTLCICAANGTSVYAADIDTDEMLAQLGKAFGISQKDFDNYDSNYAKSLPIAYKQSSTSKYLALGGVTAAGSAGINDPDQAYGSKIEAAWNIDYDNRTDTALRPADTSMYISRQRSAIKKTNVDLITFQLDGSSLLLEAMDSLMNEVSADWSKYVNDASFVSYVKDFKAQIVKEYSPQYGEWNATKIAELLEYMLYECVAYGVETINAVNTIRSYNANAVILVIGLYNPLRNLSIIADGKAIDIGNMVEEMFTACDVYLLSKTMNMDKVGFVDVSDTDTTGFGNVVLNTSDSDALVNQLYQIIRATDKQYANQNGHNKIYNRIVNALAEPCEHTKTTTKGAKPATCKEEGYTGDTVCAKCGAVMKAGSVIAKKSHSFGDWKVTKTPTCVAKGTETRTCSGCSKTETRDVAATNVHTYDNGAVTKEPGCDTKGVKTYSCTNAGCNHKKTEDIAATGHKMDKGTITTKPGCDTKGVKTYSCTNAGCNHKKTEDIAATGHTWDKGTVTTKPGCETKGVKTYSCTNAGCNKTKTEDVAATGHKWVDDTVITEPGCETEGEKKVVCSVCEKTQNQAIPAAGHKWDEGAITKDPTCEEDGEKAVTCTVCGKADVEAIPATGHEWDEGTVTKEPACEEDGEKTVTCTVCGKTDVEAIPATGHSYSEYTSNNDATCQKDGTKSAVCKNCGAKDTAEDPESKTDHVYEDGFCVYCNAEQEKKSGAALWITLGVAVPVLAAGGVAGFFFFKKKKV